MRSKHLVEKRSDEPCGEDNSSEMRLGDGSFGLEELEGRVMLSAQIDPSFGQHGEAAGTIHAARGFSYVASAVQRDQKIIVASTPYVLRAPPSGTLSLQRFNANGTLDRGFGFSGVVDDPTPRFLLPLRDGRILVVFNSSILRFNSNGSLDTTFNFRFPKDELATQYIFQVSILHDGRLLVLGPGASNIELVFTRHLPNGQPDPTFGTDGVLKPIAQLCFDATFTMQPDGKVLVFNSYGLERIELYRLNPDFTLDTTFASGGRLALRGQYGVGGIYLQRDGKIILRELDYSKSVLIRLWPSGRRDAGFGDNGRLEIPGSSADVMLHRHGKIVLANSRGDSFDSAHREEVDLLQFNYDGTPDTTFARNGTFTVPDVGPEAFEDVVRQGDRTVFLTGDKPRSAPVIHLMRIFDDGKPRRDHIAAQLFAPAVPGVALSPLQLWLLSNEDFADEPL